MAEEHRLALSRETLRDLQPSDEQTAGVQGGTSMAQVSAVNTLLCKAITGTPVGDRTGPITINNCRVTFWAGNANQNEEMIRVQTGGNDPWYSVDGKGHVYKMGQGPRTTDAPTFSIGR